MSTNTVDAEVARQVQAEIDREEGARVERIRQAVIERQADEQRREERIQRIADYKAQAAQLREQAAAIRAAAEPLLLELEKLEGVRPMWGRSRSIALEEQAHRKWHGSLAGHEKVAAVVALECLPAFSGDHMTLSAGTPNQ